MLGFRDFRDLLVLSLVSTFRAETAGATGAWAQTFLIQVRINSWKKSLFGAGAGVGLGSEDGLKPGGSGLKVERVKAGLPWWAKGIVERREQSRE